MFLFFSRIEQKSSWPFNYNNGQEEVMKLVELKVQRDLAKTGIQETKFLDLAKSRNPEGRSADTGT